MSTYTNITKDEIEAFLFPQGFSLLNLSDAEELVYGKRVNNDNLKLCLRIYTGISKHSGQSRDVGEDAIRCVIFQKIGDVVRKVSGSKRVHRVQGWKKNLQNRIDKCYDMLGPACEKCGALMVERSGPYGNFFGCSAYPQCKHIVKIASENV